ncbi:MAG: efflux RND transporter permease subunit [Desulfobacteraceae bacterium]|nr:efflux RND transporter permease subunit [Desulfobacteraceae bacterium]
MSISQFSVRRPVLTVMVSLIVIILGAVALFRLSIDLMPDITYPTLSISTSYENASPEEVEELITRTIEEALSAVPGVEEVTSVSGEGSSNVRVSFDWGIDLDAAASDVRDRLDRVIPRLPDDADRPRLRKFDLASFPILILGISSDLDPIQVRKIIDNQIKNRIERIPGMASLDVRGGLEREIHVNLNAEKIKALELTIDRILSRLREENVNLPAGIIEQGNLDVTIRTPGIYNNLDELRNTVVAVRDGVPIQLKEIAAVVDTHQRISRIIRINGKPGVQMIVNKQSGKNTVEVARSVLEEIEHINRDIPQLQVVPIIDTSDYIQRSISNVGSTIFYGGILAVVVLMLFLRNLASTAIIATTIPISIIATFALMYFGGFTLNLMTLGGLALGVGMLVDNAIVVLENIFRLREYGQDSKVAAVEGSREVTAAVIASTLTTLVVFLPLIFVKGMSGIMFKQLSYVVSFSLGCSLLVALTLVPMLASRLRKPVPGYAERDLQGKGIIFRITGRFFSALEAGYTDFLGFALRRRIWIILSTLVILGGSLLLIPMVGVELMPASDEGEVRVSAEMAVGINLDIMDRMFRGVEEIVYREVPEIKNTVTFIGGSPWRGGGNNASMRIALKPIAERNRSTTQIAADLRRKLVAIPGVNIRIREGQGLFILRMGASGTERVQIEVMGHDIVVADALAGRVEAMLETIDGITDARISRETGTPEELIIVDRQKAADMNLTISKIAKMLQTVLSGSSAGNFREGGTEYRIRLKLEAAEKRSLDEILDLPLTNADGDAVVLRNVVSTMPRQGPVRVERKDQQRVVFISANTSGRDMGAILSDVREGLRSIPVPRDFGIVIGGDFEEQKTAFRELLMSFILALVLVYMVMASLYESLRYPLVVMFSVPLASIGVILMLFLTGTTFNVQSYIGCIMLGGIAVNNAILLVDHINLLRNRDGMDVEEAIREAGRRRLRPILMTAMTTILAMTPLALGLGEGSEAQAPMARAIIGGLISSNLITLIVTPTLYALFERRAIRQQTARSLASAS